MLGSASLLLVLTLCQGLVLLPSSGELPVARQQTREPAEELQLRLLDHAGQPLQGGVIWVERLYLGGLHGPPEEGGVEHWSPSPPENPTQKIIGADGLVALSRERFLARSGEVHLRIRRDIVWMIPSELGMGTIDGGSEPMPLSPPLRAEVHAPVTSPGPIPVTMVPATVVCRGKLVDDRGRPIDPNAIRLKARHDSFCSCDLSVRCLGTPTGYELLGWPDALDWQIEVSYGHGWLEAAPVKLSRAQAELDLVGPSTGYVQIHTEMAFTPEVLEAVYEGADGRRDARRFSWGSTSHILRAGQYRLTIELMGEPLLDLGTVEVAPDATLEISVRLPAILRTFRLHVVGPDGSPIRQASVRIVGKDPRYKLNPEKEPWAILVPTLAPEVALEIEAPGFEPVRLDGVASDYRIVLTPKSP